MEKKQKRNPWSFIPTQYFAEGLPYVLVNNLSVVMYKSLHVANDLIGFTSFLYLPWSIKFLWSPLVDARSTKRGWVLLMQLLMAACFGLIALAVQLPAFFVLTLAVFTVITFLSATHDIATDGFYLHALGKKDQAFFTGIRATFYRISMIFGSGILVMIAGSLAGEGGDMSFGWSAAFVISAALFLIFFVFHKFILPYPATDRPVRSVKGTSAYKEAFAQYFRQKRIGVILAFILLYRLGESLLVKMAQPFLMDPPEAGGMGVDVSEVGFMYGTVGIIALVIGGILGGWLIKRYSLKKLIWPMALFMNVPNLFYVYLAGVQPEFAVSLDLSWLSFSGDWTLIMHPIIQACIIIEQFGYGLGFTAFMVYLLYVSRGEFKTTHFAISTGFMAWGMMLPGLVSGWLQMQLGYFWLFLLSAVFTIPGMIVILFLPFDFKNNENNNQ